ncbi:MAG: hypothetical protein ACM3YE_05060 [Bacteroidota bacterium]
MKKFIGFLLFILFLGSILYGLQYYFQIFNEPLRQINENLTFFNEMVNNQIVTGISIGTVILLTMLIIIPVFAKDINTRSYFKNIKQGVVSSFIFYLSQLINAYFEKIGQVYLLVSIIATMIITIILIQIGAKMFRDKEEAMEFRTGYIASITAGLLFSVLLQMLMLGVDFLKAQMPVKPINFNLNF